MLETYKNSRGRISSRVLYYTYDLKDQLLTANKEGEIRHPVAITSMAQERRVQIRQGIHSPIMAKLVTTLDLTIYEQGIMIVKEVLS